MKEGRNNRINEGRRQRKKDKHVSSSCLLSLFFSPASQPPHCDVHRWLASGLNIGCNGCNTTLNTLLQASDEARERFLVFF